MCIRDSNADLAMFAEGLSDEIITGLNRFSYLRVIARSSTLRYASQTSDVRSLGKSLGARYLMEGNLRQAGTKVRFAVQLVDTTTGAHLWAENYERPFSPEAVFELQDELVPRIVSTIADSHGVLPRSMSEAVQSRAPEELSPYEAVLRSFDYTQNVTPAALSDSVFCLELAVQKAPAYAGAWAMLGLMLVQDYAQGFNYTQNVTPAALSDSVFCLELAVQKAPAYADAWAMLGLMLVQDYAQGYNYTQNVTHAALSDSVFCLELAVQKAPAYADAWAMLGLMLVQDYAQGYNVRAYSLKQAEEAARKAVELAPSNHLAWASLARVHFFQKEQQSFR